MRTFLFLLSGALFLSACEKDLVTVNHPDAVSGKEALDDGLVAYWKFDEGTGKYIYNETSGLLTGQKYGASWVEGVAGTALRFDGINDYAKVSGLYPHILGDLEEGSISIWFRYADSLADESKPIQPLMYVGKSDTAGIDDCFILEAGHGDPQNSTLYFTWIRHGDLPLCFSTAQNLTPDAWYHFVAMVGENVNGLGERNTGYLNGVEMTDRVYNYGDPMVKVFFKMFPADELERIWFGYGKTRDTYAPAFEYLAGMVDEIRIYDRPLTSDEVMMLYQEGNQSVPPEISLQLSGGPFYTEPAAILVIATATDADGSIERVEFYLDGAQRFIDYTEPYKFKYTGIMAGKHTLMAKAIDNSGFTTQTEKVITIRSYH